MFTFPLPIFSNSRGSLIHCLTQGFATDPTVRSAPFSKPCRLTKWRLGLADGRRNAIGESVGAGRVVRVGDCVWRRMAAMGESGRCSPGDGRCDKAESDPRPKPSEWTPK